MCDDCLQKYRNLQYDAQCDYVLCPMPFCAITWADEHPAMEEWVAHDSCRDSIVRLVAVRTELWTTGALPVAREHLWVQARQAIPTWPGFRRLSLTPQQWRAQRGCAEELDEFMAAATADFSEVVVEDLGDGLTKWEASKSLPARKKRK